MPIALSPGFRWGPSVLPGDAVTMDFVYAHTTISHPDVYVQEMTGEAIKTVLEDVCDNLFNPRIASPGMLPSGGLLPHLVCSRPVFIGGGEKGADQHGGT